MKERPILFSAPMVRALLDGAKTQTRRIVKTPARVPYDAIGVLDAALRDDPKATVHVRPEYGNVYVKTHGGEFMPGLGCPYGVVGDRLWVKETFQVKLGRRKPYTNYRADAENVMPWTPPILMPRWASRITLEITDVRVQRVHDISEVDAVAEGVMGLPKRGGTPKATYMHLWEDINGEGAWQKNPWVFALTFKRMEQA